MNILLTFTGFHDPYAIGLVGQEEQPGPILSLVGARSFDHVVLFSTPGAEKNTLATKEALRSLHPGLSVEVRDFPLGSHRLHRHSERAACPSTGHWREYAGGAVFYR